MRSKSEVAGHDLFVSKIAVVVAALMILTLVPPAAAQTFSDPVTYTLVSENPGRAATGDLDGDGDADFAVPTYVSGSPGYVEVLLSLEDGSSATPTAYGVGNQPRSVAVADLDGDGDLDLAVANRGDGTVSVLVNRGDGTFDAAVDHAAGSYPSVAVAGDLDGDGLADLAVANTYDVLWLANNGDGTFAAPQSYAFGSRIVGLDIGEMDGDTDLDLVVLQMAEGSNIREAWVTVLWNDGSGTFEASPRYEGGSWSDGYDYALHPSVDSLALGDLTGNGYLDVLVGATLGWRTLPLDGSPLGRVNVLENWGGGSLMPGESRGSCHDHQPQLDTGDLDGDGDLEVVTGRVYFLNIGAGYFGGSQGHGGDGKYVTVDDLYPDGLPDLVLPRDPYSVQVVFQGDVCPGDPNKVEPGQCGCGQLDTDSDGDGVADCNDQCPGEPDTDSDGDRVVDCLDLCPDDPGKVDPGVCGCGVPDEDTDGDGTLDCLDGCPADPNKAEPGVCGCGMADVDSDGDGALDCDDVCMGFDDTVDCNGNGVPDGCDIGGLYEDERKLTASDGAASDYFGSSVAIHGDTIVVGARAYYDPGSAYVYRYDAVTGSWVEEQKLTASDGAAGDYFGSSVAIHGDTIVVGAYRDDDLGSDSGSAYVFRYDPTRSEGDRWVEEPKLTASDGAASDYFGVAVSIHGDTIVVGAYQDDDLGSNSGSVYVYRHDTASGLWAEEPKLTASDGAASDYFGGSVSIHGDTIVVGASGDDDLGSSSGSAYVYRYDAVSGLWAEEQKLTASDGAIHDYFGRNVSIHGDTIAVGAYGDNDLGPDSGSAYVYRYDGATWNQEQKLTASDGGYEDRFGNSVSTDGDTIVVGADGDGPDSVYVYRHDTASGLWAEEQKLTASDGDTTDRFGYSVSTDGDTIAVGAHQDDDLGSNSGSAYTYERSVSDDCDGDGVPDECQPDTDLDGLIDACDCDPDNVDCTTDCSDNNGNGIPDCGEPAGGPRTVTETGTVASGEEDHYGPYTVEESTEFAARLTTLINNADLYVRWDQAPTTSQFDCSATTPVLDECVLTVPVGVTEAYVMVYGAATGASDYTLTVDYVSPGGGCADDDGDGVCNADDGCPADPNKTDPGQCGCGVPDTDSDGDGVADCIDQCPGEPDTDSDGDGTLDCSDACPNDNPDDPDGNGICGDQSGSGGPRTDVVSGIVVHTGEDHYSYDVVEGTDFSAYLATSVGQAMVHVKFGTPPTTSDSTCKRNVYAGWEWGCDLTVPAGETRAYVMVYGAATGASDYTLTVDYVSPGGGCADDDGDGVCNADDGCPADPNKTDPGQCGCGVPDTDSDGDGTLDCSDACPNDNPDDPDGNGICGDQSGSGGPRTDVVSGIVVHTGEDHYSYDVVEGTDFSAYLATSVGQAMVHVKFGTPPTTSDSTCKRNVYAGWEWGCDLTVPAGETRAYVMVYGAATGASDYTLTVDYVSPGGGCADDDGDGVCNADDGCPADPNKTDPGQCGCGVPDTDSDGDGTLDCSDACPNDNPDDPDGNGICGDQSGSGGPRTDVVSGIVVHTGEDHYSYDVVEGTDFSAYLATSVGQAMVHVKFGTPPTTSDSTCKRNVYAGWEWGCDLTVPAGETRAYVMVYGAATGASDYTLTVDYVSPGGGCADDDGDGVCDADDICPGFDDTVDSDGDGVPDGCDS